MTHCFPPQIESFRGAFNCRDEMSATEAFGSVSGGNAFHKSVPCISAREALLEVEVSAVRRLSQGDGCDRGRDSYKACHSHLIHTLMRTKKDNNYLSD